MSSSRKTLTFVAAFALVVIGSGVASAVVTDGLVSYHNFDGNLLDTSALASVHNGTYVGTGSPVYISAKFGQGIDLPGVDQKVVLDDTSDFHFQSTHGGNVSISAWFRVDSWDQGWQALVVKGEGGAVRLHRRGGDQRINWNAGGGGDLDQPYNTPPGSTPEYHHVVASRNGAGLKEIWIDGMLRASATNAGGIDDRLGRSVMIGANPDDGGGRRWFDGVFDDVGIWGRALTPGEVLAIWDGGAGATIESLRGVTAVEPPTPVARLTAPVGLDMSGGAYGESGGVASAPISWTLEERGAPTTVVGFQETIWDAALPNGDVTGNIENVRAAAAGPLGPNDAQGILTGHLHYQDDGSVDARAAALGAPGFDAGNFTMLWTTDFTPDLGGDWGFRNNNVDDRYSFWIDLDQDGTLESDERFFERGGCCAGSGDRFISQASSSIDALLNGSTYLLGFVMNDTGGGGYFRDMEFLRPGGSWTDLNPSATGNMFTTTIIPWTTLATGINQVGDTVSDGLFGVSMTPGDHYLRLTVEAGVAAAGIVDTATVEGLFTFILIPEPSTFLIWALGLLWLGLSRSFVGRFRHRRSGS